MELYLGSERVLKSPDLPASVYRPQAPSGEHAQTSLNKRTQKMLEE